MKTFKLVQFVLVDESGEKTNIPLIDGLIINKEKEHEQYNWLIEVYTDGRYASLFSELEKEKKTAEWLATITHTQNDPARMVGVVRSVTLMNERMSVLIDAALVRKRANFAQVVLEDLVGRGLQGETLLQRFKEQMEAGRR